MFKTEREGRRGSTAFNSPTPPRSPNLVPIRTPLERNSSSSYTLPFGSLNSIPNSSLNSTNNSRRNSVSSINSNSSNKDSNLNPPNTSNRVRRTSNTPSINLNLNQDGNPTMRIQLLDLVDLKFSYASIFQSVSVLISLWSIWERGFSFGAILIGVISSSTFNSEFRCLPIAPLAR